MAAQEPLAVHLGATGFEPAILSVPNRALYQTELHPEIALEPFQLPHSFPAMAIRTTNLALRDLFQDTPPRKPTVNHTAYVAGLFAANMIEFKNLRIGLSAVYTMMIAQIIHYALSIFAPVTYLVRITVSTILLRICPVQLAMINAIALPAKVMPYTFITRAKRKHREGQHPRTLPTGFHANICSLCCLAYPLKQQRMKTNVARKIDDSAVACE